MGNLRNFGGKLRNFVGNLGDLGEIEKFLEKMAEFCGKFEKFGGKSTNFVGNMGDFWVGRPFC